jgi:deoxyadenosine/deoxycytidine kinase
MTTIEPDRCLQKRIGVVGPCTAGKSTLINRLIQAGIQARHIAQEHSYVPYMWQHLTNPDVLIYLDVSFPVSLQRRKFTWTLAEYEEQLHRLRHARENAHFYLHTDPYTPDEVSALVIEYLASCGVYPASADR